MELICLKCLKNLMKQSNKPKLELESNFYSMRINGKCNICLIKDKCFKLIKSPQEVSK